MQHRKTKWVWIDGFSSGVWKWECFRTVKCQQVESSRWMEHQQKNRNGPVQCVCEERWCNTKKICHRAQSPRWCMGLYQLTKIRWSGCGPHINYANSILVWCWRCSGSRRLRAWRRQWGWRVSADLWQLFAAEVSKSPRQQLGLHKLRCVLQKHT